MEQYAVIESGPDGQFHLVGPFADEASAAEWVRVEEEHGSDQRHLAVRLDPPAS